MRNMTSIERGMKCPKLHTPKDLNFEVQWEEDSG